MTGTLLTGRVSAFLLALVAIVLYLVGRETIFKARNSDVIQPAAATEVREGDL